MNPAGYDLPRIFPFVAVCIAFAVLYGSRLSAGHSRETSEGLVFPMKPIYLWARGLLLPAYMGFFLWIAWRQHHVMPWPIIFLVLIAVAIGLLQMPGTIVLTATAVTQRFWFQAAKTIRYDEVMAIQAMQAGRTTLVLGDNRVRIRHSSNHAASGEFRIELERRTGKRVVT